MEIFNFIGAFFAPLADFVGYILTALGAGSLWLFTKLSAPLLVLRVAFQNLTGQSVRLLAKRHIAKVSQLRIYTLHDLSGDFKNAKDNADEAAFRHCRKAEPRQEKQQSLNDVYALLITLAFELASEDRETRRLYKRLLDQCDRAYASMEKLLNRYVQYAAEWDAQERVANKVLWRIKALGWRSWVPLTAESKKRSELQREYRVKLKQLFQQRKANLKRLNRRFRYIQKIVKHLEKQIGEFLPIYETLWKSLKLSVQTGRILRMLCAPNERARDIRRRYYLDNLPELPVASQHGDIDMQHGQLDQWLRDNLSFKTTDQALVRELKYMLWNTLGPHADLEEKFERWLRIHCAIYEPENITRAWVLQLPLSNSEQIAVTSLQSRQQLIDAKRL